MAENQGQEKTEAPTQKKRDDARKEGQVAMSREVSSAALLGAFLIYFVVAGRSSFDGMVQLWTTMFREIYGPDLTIDSVYGAFKTGMGMLSVMLLGLFALVMTIAILTSVAQVGVKFNPLKFQGNRLNPLQGLKRIFGWNGVAELFKGLFKMGVIVYITYLSLNAVIHELLTLSKLPLGGIFAFNFDLMAQLFSRVTFALILLAIFDYLFQRWNHDQKLRMTKQEVKEELKQTEGDPQLRARIRQIQRDTSRARMMQSVPKADVVVTNPEHYAVALEYDREVMTAPRVIAKGADYIAHRIKEVARENKIAIVENAPLARGLFREVDVGQEVPEEFFRTVAEILAYVYRLENRTTEGALTEGGPTVEGLPS